MQSFLDVLIRIWPLLVAGTGAFAVVIQLLWKISAGVQFVTQTLTQHTEELNRLNTKTEDHETRIVKLETRATH